MTVGVAAPAGARTAHARLPAMLPLRAAGVMWLRQVRRFFRSPLRLVGSLTQPLLFLVTFAAGFGTMFAEAGLGSYTLFLGPGTIGMTIVFTAVFVGLEVIEDRAAGFLRVTMVAPVPRWATILGRIGGGASIAMAQGVLVLALLPLVGLKPAWSAVPAILAAMALTGSAFAAAGTVLGLVLRDAPGFSAVMNFALLPILLFSGALFPLAGVPGPLLLAMQVNPLTYGIDALQALLLDGGHFSLAVDFAVLAAATAVFSIAATLLFARSG